jgi:hypothetical protein
MGFLGQFLAAAVQSDGTFPLLGGSNQRLPRQFAVPTRIEKSLHTPSWESRREPCGGYVEVHLMTRRVLPAIAVLFVFAAFIAAAEIKGKIIKVDAENNKITVTVDDKDKEFTLTKDTKIISPKGNDLKGGLKSKRFSEEALKKGVPATITTEKVDDKEVVKEVKLTGGKKKADQ